MKYICRILIIFFVCFFSIVANTLSNREYISIENNTDTISVARKLENDIIYQKNNTSITTSIQRQDNNIINKTSSDSSDNGIQKPSKQNVSQFEELLSYIYTISYLENKEKTNFSKSLSEVHPNAP